MAPRTPKDLGPRGKRTWTSTVADFDLRADELATLEELCRALDTLDVIEEALRGAPLIVAGHAGQQRAHPLLSEARGYRASIVQLTRVLGLSDAVDDGEVVPSPASQRARKAAMARWGSRG